MKIRTRTLQAGPGGVVQPGAILDVPRAEAEALIAGGFAELVAPERKPVPRAPESAAVRPPENAARRNPAPRVPARQTTAATPSEELQQQLEPIMPAEAPDGGIPARIPDF